MFKEILHIIICVIFSVCTALPKNDLKLPKAVLQSLLGSRSKNFIVFLSKDKNMRADDHEFVNYSASFDDSESSLEKDARDEANDDAAQLLLQLLRTRPDDVDKDILQETKDIIREGLRSRCIKVELCIKKCPRKKLKCQKKCEEAFDDLEFCQPIKACKTPKCGRTMPPKWSLRIN